MTKYALTKTVISNIFILNVLTLKLAIDVKKLILNILSKISNIIISGEFYAPERGWYSVCFEGAYL